LVAINLINDGCPFIHPRSNLYEKYTLGLSPYIIKKNHRLKKIKIIIIFWCVPNFTDGSMIHASTACGGLFRDYTSRFLVVMRSGLTVCLWFWQWNWLIVWAGRFYGLRVVQRLCCKLLRIIGLYQGS
jgi:hypothetical protein